MLVFGVFFLSVLFSIFCKCSTSVFVGIHVSAAYISMGRMHVSTSFHMVFIFIWLKFLLPARLNIVCSAASVLPLSFFMWSSIVPLLLIVIPRYLYVSVLSITMFPSLNLGSWLQVLGFLVTSSKATGAPELHLIEHTGSVTRSLPAHVIRLLRCIPGFSQSISPSVSHHIRKVIYTYRTKRMASYTENFSPCLLFNVHHHLLLTA